LSILGDADRQSQIWERIRAALEARLAEHRERNDASLSPERTEKLRGRIAEVKWLLGEGEERPETVEPEAGTEGW